MPRCRSCAAELSITMVDLGSMPLANSYLVTVPEQPDSEPRYPLHAQVCGTCLLVQVGDVVAPEEIFEEYAYFSSYSSTWVEHARLFAEQAISELGSHVEHGVVEIASNDGYLLQHFSAAGVPVLGIEPANNVAEVARERGIPTESTFFGAACARELRKSGMKPALIVANNVLAHVPDLNDFVSGLAILTGSSGLISIEVPHVLRLIERVEFDTIYHEHFSYFSLLALGSAFGAHDLEVIRCEELPTHGGSLRLWVAPRGSRATDASVGVVEALERAGGLADPATYPAFSDAVGRTLSDFRSFVANARAAGDTIVAYGAAAKGNTFLNAAGVTTDDIPYVVDRSPHKQGHFLPGSHLPVRDPSVVAHDRPKYVLILPWNLRDEIRSQMEHVAEWGGSFVTAIPAVEVFR
ncbi:MAG: class I SAM-dependent methyltransferase [Acidimicrobiia bacterium]